MATLSCQRGSPEWLRGCPAATPRHSVDAASYLEHRLHSDFFFGLLRNLSQKRRNWGQAPRPPDPCGAFFSLEESTRQCCAPSPSTFHTHASYHAVHDPTATTSAPFSLPTGPAPAASLGPRTTPRATPRWRAPATRLGSSPNHHLRAPQQGGRGGEERGSMDLRDVDADARRHAAKQGRSGVCWSKRRVARKRARL